MAINYVEYNLMRLFREQKLFTLGGDLLELGEANWYGDIDPKILREDILKFAAPENQKSLLTELDDALKSGHSEASWTIARIYWNTFLNPTSITAIDFHGTSKALKLDLNCPIDLKRQFHVVNNCGTLEHIFNVGQAFKTIHDHTFPGGFMIHQVPFTGWIDHGFYNFNPTFFWDLAFANQYHICIFVYLELNPPKVIQLLNREQILEMAKTDAIGKNANLLAVFRRPERPEPFKIPMQGYYGGTISRTASDAWHSLR
jgi:hypothetical protein